jgi:hypothetical protein
MVPMWVMESCPRQDINMIAILVGGGGEGGGSLGLVVGSSSNNHAEKIGVGGRKRAPTCLRQTTTHVDANAKD